MRRRPLALALAGAALCAACGSSSAAPPPTTPSPAATTVPGSPRSSDAVAPQTEAPDPDAFVSTDGRRFTIDGAPFTFIGANIYDAAATDSYACNPSIRLGGDTLERTLQELHDSAGVTVLRFWAYQDYTAGGTDFSGVDRVIDAARNAGMRVIPVLENGFGECTTGPPKQAKFSYADDTWYTEGYRVPYGDARLSFRDYARVVAEHYRDEPTILGWMMMNEAETTRRTDDGDSALVGFGQDMAQVLHAADANHLVTLGTQSNGAPGASGPDFTAVYGLPGMDFAEVHDWAYWGSDTEAMPGGDGAEPPAAGSDACQGEYAKIGCSFALAPALDKPVIVGEAGIEARDTAARDRRADLFRAKIDADFAAGAAGWMVWSVTTSITDGYDVILGTDDPLLDVMAEQAAEFR